MRMFDKVSFNTYLIDRAIANKPYDDVFDEYCCIQRPHRSSKYSAGYDFYAPYDFTIFGEHRGTVYTGIKVYTEPDEYLALHVRSSMGIKHGIMLNNVTGIVDHDYVNNPQNEGHIMLSFKNTSNRRWDVKQGDKIAQGIFCKYCVTDDDCADGERFGGIGSTGK